MALSVRPAIQFSQHYDGGNHLDLSRKDITDQDIPNLIAFLAQKKQITSLDLRNNRITTEGANLFMLNTQLISLNLQNNLIHQHSLDLLATFIRQNRIAHNKRLLSEKKSWWDKLITFFVIMSEASNIGIVIDMASQWYKPILTVAGGILGSLVYYADPIIYCFKSLVRLTRIVGREVFGVTFEEEKNGAHKYQTAADVASLTMFGLSIALFIGALIAPPIGITVAWCFALGGLGIGGYFDYSHQEKLAHDKYKRLLDEGAPAHEIDNVRKDYISKRNSKRLFYGLLIGLTLLLICGSAAVFAPPALAPILYVVSKIASAYLVGIALSRFANFAFPNFTNKIVGYLNQFSNWLFPKKNAQPATPSSSPTHAATASTEYARLPSAPPGDELEVVRMEAKQQDASATMVAPPPFNGRLPSPPPYVSVPGSSLVAEFKGVKAEKSLSDQKSSSVDRSLTQCRTTQFSPTSRHSTARSYKAADDMTQVQRPKLTRQTTA